MMMMTADNSKRKQHDHHYSRGDNDRERKRQRKNLREQGRSQEIASLIGELKSFLEHEGVGFTKPTKSSILLETVKFIRALKAHRRAQAAAAAE